jgi:hypothetical protein
MPTVGSAHGGQVFIEINFRELLIIVTRRNIKN